MCSSDLEGWKPTAEEALTVGLVQKVVPQALLMEEANRIAQDWITNKEERQFLANSSLKALQAANTSESVQLADAFMSAAFLKGAYHSAGTCTFYGTANTNQLVFEAMGLMLPGANW